MDIDITNLIVIGVFFIVGFLLSRLLKIQKKIVGQSVPLQRNDNLEILEAIENKKQLQIDSIMLKLNDIQIKLDLLESKILQSENRTSQENTEGNIIKNITPNPANPDKTSQYNEIDDITNQSVPEISQIENTKNKSQSLNDKHNATEHYILKIILKESLTSNEIKNAIGRTREHTSRLMKKLYELKLVDRDITTKPFKYKLTEQGKKYIGEQVGKKEINQENTLNSPNTEDSLIDLSK